MSIHSSDLKTASFLQERHSVPLDLCAQKLKRSVSSVKRSITFLNFSLNMTHLYQTLYLSPGTKKKDSQAFSKWLNQYELYTEVLPRRGVRAFYTVKKC